ncbi:MAG: hypothetical protein PHE67_06045 [Campylobacterales bacterium]|nr:hypothetical protein [Campylobacterales bacterium]
MKIFSLLLLSTFLFADTLPLPQLNPKTGKWEYVDDGKPSKQQQRLNTASDDARQGLPQNLFDKQKDINPAEYGRLGKMSLSISGGTMEFFGKKKMYAPIQKMITIGESGALRVYCNEPDCRDYAPELLYYSYQVNNGSLELFLDAIANTPITIKVDNSFLDENKVVDGLSVKPENSKLKPKNITVQIMGIK